jgi:hypothetical protein
LERSTRLVYILGEEYDNHPEIPAVAKKKVSHLLTNNLIIAATKVQQTSVLTCTTEQRRYSQSGNDQDDMIEIKKSRISCQIFSIFMNNPLEWRKSETGVAKPIGVFVLKP